jgi:hypothetical protein
LPTIEPHPIPQPDFQALPWALDQAPSLAPWRQLSSRVASIIKTTPPVAGRLLCAPRAAFHATAIYLLNHPHQADQDAGAALLALSPTELVACCFAPAHGFMWALKKCGAEVQRRSFYAELNALLLSPLAGEITSEAYVTPELLAFFRETQHLDPLVQPARHALCLDIGSAKQLDAMLRFCRRLGVFPDDASEAKIIRFAATRGLGRYFAKRLERCVSPLNLALPAPLRHIRTARELASIASKHANCLGGIRYKVQLGLGSHIYLLGDAPLNCLVELRHEHGAVWSIIECEPLDAHERASWETREHICELLRQAGLDAQPAAFEELWLDIEPFRTPQPPPLYAG